LLFKLRIEKEMEKFKSKVMASWWQYDVRPCFKIIVPLAILVSVALLYNFEWRIENRYSYANWNAITLLKSAPKIAHYKDVDTLKKPSTVG
jgi:hypothetical protein